MTQMELTQSEDASTGERRLPRWVRPSKKSNPYLRDNLKNHVDGYYSEAQLFLAHKNGGIKNLAGILAAEFAVVSLAYSNANAPKGFSVIALLFLAMTSVILAWSAVQSCRRSYAASLQNVVAVSKTLWAMGLMSAVKVNASVLDTDHCPVPNDSSLTSTWKLRDACNHKTTDDYVAHHLNQKVNTYFGAWVTIWLFCVSAVVFGLYGAWAVHSK